MELAMTPMTERQRKYRENYHERVAGWYNGWLHIQDGKAAPKIVPPIAISAPSTS